MTDTSTPHPVSATQAEVPILDQAELLHRCRGKAHLAAGLTRMFRESAPALLDSFRAAILANDAATAASKAHALKGNAASVSAKLLAATASEVDRAVRAQGADALAPLMLRLERDFNHAMNALLAFESAVLAASKCPTNSSPKN